MVLSCAAYTLQVGFDSRWRSQTIELAVPRGQLPDALHHAPRRGALLPADPKLRSKAEKSIEITGAPYSANLAAASISNERALDTVRALAQGRCVVG